MKHRSSIAIAFTVLGISSLSTQAATVFSGTFTWGADGNVASFPYNGAAIENLDVSNATKVGITSTSSSSNFRGDNWALDGAPIGSLTGSIDTTKYIEFTVSANAGYTIDMATLVFGIGRSGTGPRQWEWRSSVDLFAEPIATYTTLNAGLIHSDGVLTNPDTNSNWAGNVMDLTASKFQDQSSITFRLYGYNSEGGPGTGGIQGPLTFTGTIAAVVPEPSATLLGLVGVIALIRRRR